MANRITKVSDTDMKMVVKIAKIRKTIKRWWRWIYRPFRKTYFFFENFFLHRRPEGELRARIEQANMVLRIVKANLDDERAPARIAQYTADKQKLQRALNKKLRIKGNPGKDDALEVKLKPANLTAKVGKGD